MTYDEILNLFLDELDNRFSPEKVGRTDGHAIYKLGNAIAKTQERSEAVLEANSTPFDAKVCSVEQLEVIGQLNNTPRYEGKRTFLSVSCKNNSAESKTLYAGVYQYEYSGDKFLYTLADDIVLYYGIVVNLGFFVSQENKAIEITAQDSIKITRVDEEEIDSDIVFFCDDSIKGREEESDLEYRERLVSYQKKQNALDNIEREIEHFPYIQSANVFYNTTDSDVVLSGYTVEPYNMLITVIGDMTREVADIVFNNGVYFTAGSDDTTKTKTFEYDLHLTSPVQIHINKAESYYFNVSIRYEQISMLIDMQEISDIVKSNLKTLFNNGKWTTITEADIYNAIDKMGFNTIKILNVDFTDEGGNALEFARAPSGSVLFIKGVNFVS